MPRPTPVQLLFSPEGRVRRVAFILLAAGMLSALAAIDYGLPAAPWRPVAAGPAKAALFVAGACVISKRLHDHGRSGWWWPLPVFALMLAWPRPQGWLGWAACAALAAAVVELGLRPGDAGFNRFGPPAR